MFDPQELNNAFTDKLKADTVYAPKWMVDWAYQTVRKQRKKKYEEELPQDFYRFEGIDDIAKWYNWFAPYYTNYIPDEQVKPLINISKQNDIDVFKKLGIDYDFAGYYDDRVGINNAHDFIFPQFYPVPERMKIQSVLDFGAGSGRQANLWHKHYGATYIGMDATPKAYCIQHMFYKSLGVKVNDYVFGGFDGFKDNHEIYHIPTWRFDLIPDNSIDMVLTIQVLGELSKRLSTYVLQQVHRVLKPGGMFYIRDHKYQWMHAGTLDADKYLLENGFQLEFTPYVYLDEEIMGMPRIYRKTDAHAESLWKRTKQPALKSWLLNIDAKTGGKLSSLLKKK